MSILLLLTASFLLTFFACTESTDNQHSNPKSMESISEDNALNEPTNLDGEDGEDGQDGQNGKRGKLGRNGGNGGNGGDSLSGNGGNGGNGGDAD